MVGREGLQAKFLGQNGSEVLYHGQAICDIYLGSSELRFFSVSVPDRRYYRLQISKKPHQVRTTTITSSDLPDLPLYQPLHTSHFALRQNKTQTASHSSQPLIMTPPTINGAARELAIHINLDFGTMRSAVVYSYSSQVSGFEASIAQSSANTDSLKI
jgi:hypothetical protein